MTYVKICGLTNLEDARAAAEAGADWLGFIFYPPSPRYVQPECAKEIILGIRRLSPATRFVGVFVNETVARVRAVVEQCELDRVQLHGDESSETVRELAPHVYKSLRAADAAQARAWAQRYRTSLEGHKPAFIVDALHPKMYGGTGERADWAVAGELAREFPILLAGGLSPDNVAEAIAVVHPWGVDVSSGVERAPGLKDHARVREFISRAKERRGDGEIREQGDGA